MLRANVDNLRTFSIALRAVGIDSFLQFFDRAPRALILRPNLGNLSTTNV